MNAKSFPDRNRGFLGNLFSFLKPTRKTQPEPEPELAPSVPEATDVLSGAPRKKLLIIDDDPIILKTTSSKLKARGYVVATATDGSEAIHAVRDDKPDLILLDLSFPPDVAHGGGVPWDGFLLMSWLRRFQEAHTIPIIVITGAEPAQNKERCLANGAIAYFQKPIDHDELLSVIAGALEDDSGTPEPLGRNRLSIPSVDMGCRWGAGALALNML